MKKSMFFLLVAWAMLSTSTKAQGPEVPSPDIRNVEAMKPGMGFNLLNLSDEQKAKLKVLHQEFATQDSVSMNKFRTEREAVREQRRKAMEQVLTSDQLEQLKKFREEARPEGMGTGMKNGCGNGPGLQCGKAKHKGARMEQNFMKDRPVGRMGQSNEDFPMDACFGQDQDFEGDRMFSVQPPRCDKKQAKAFCKQAKMKKKILMVNPEERIKNQVDRMTKQLNLTPDQAAKIQNIQRKYAQKEIANYKRVQKKLDAQKNKRDACMDEIKSVLTGDQAKKLESLKGQEPLTKKTEGPMSPR
jgi:Spy/CpxP family protein refolding chaperone